MTAYAPVVDPGSFAVTGTPIVISENLPVGAGSFAVTGTAITITPLVISVGVGSFAVSGTAITVDWGVPVGAGSFAVTGTALTISFLSNLFPVRFELNRYPAADQKVPVFVVESPNNVPKTGVASALTGYISKDGGASAALGTPNPTEVDAYKHPGVYLFTLTSAEVNASLIILNVLSSTANVNATPLHIQTTYTKKIHDWTVKSRPSTLL